MDNFANIFLAGVFIESVLDTLKLLYDSEKRANLNVDKLYALILGIVVAITTNLDFTASFGLDFNVPYLGSVFSGIILSRGGNYIHDLHKKIKGE